MAGGAGQRTLARAVPVNVHVVVDGHVQQILSLLALKKFPLLGGKERKGDSENGESFFIVGSTVLSDHCFFLREKIRKSLFIDCKERKIEREMIEGERERCREKKRILTIV